MNEDKSKTVTPKITKPRKQLQQELQHVLHGLLSLPNKELKKLTELAKVCLNR